MRKLLLFATLTAAILAGAVLAPVGEAVTRTISVRDDFYSPSSKTVKRNTFVRWVWRGDGVHNVVVARGPVRFRSRLKSGGSFTKKMTRRGTYRIVCTVHPDMRSTLRVT